MIECTLFTDTLHIFEGGRINWCVIDIDSVTKRFFSIQICIGSAMIKIQPQLEAIAVLDEMARLGYYTKRQRQRIQERIDKFWDGKNLTVQEIQMQNALNQSNKIQIPQMRPRS